MWSRTQASGASNYDNDTEPKKVIESERCCITSYVYSSTCGLEPKWPQGKARLPPACRIQPTSNFALGSKSFLVGL
eukprot:5501847-Amphidinium_carterae.1